MRKFVKTLSGMLLAASLFLPAESKADFNTIYQKEFRVTLKDVSGGERKRRLVAAVFLDEKNKECKCDLLGFLVAGENFEKNDWAEEEKNVPVQFRYTLIDPPELYLLHPEKVKVKKTVQKGTIVYRNLEGEKNEMVTLVPFEGSKEELVVKGLKKLFTSMIESAGIPFSQEALDGIINYVSREKEQKIEETIRSLNEDYIIRKIPKYVANKIAYAETSRVYAISLDAKEATGKVPITLWARLNVPHLSENQKLEDIVVNFTLNGGKEEDVEEICLRLNKETGFNSKCDIENVDLNGDGIKELIVNHLTGHSNFHHYVFEKSKSGFRKIHSSYGPGLNVIQSKTNGFFDLMISSRYIDESVPSKCLAQVELPVAKTTFKWDGEKYAEAEVVKEKYSGRISVEECEQRIGKSEKTSREIEICIYYDRKIDRRRDGMSPLQETVFYRKKEDGGWQEFDRSRGECASNKISLENPNSIVEVLALGYFKNERGNGWIRTFGSQKGKISWNTKGETVRLDDWNGYIPKDVPLKKSW